MKPQAQYRGARWVRADFHLHSPGAHGFKFPFDPAVHNPDETVRQYVAQLANQGIEIAAITDYQQIRKDWFAPIQAAARERGIYVYPGVELSFGGSSGGKRGLHLIAIFPYNTDIEQCNRVIDKMLDDESSEPLLKPGGKHRDLKPKEALRHCLPRFQKATESILIVAHPNGSKGLLTSYSLGQAAQLLQSVSFDAVESLTEKDRQRLLSTGKIDAARLDTLASIESSDNHSIPEIGAKTRPDGSPRATYLKLSALDDLNAIRLALRDAEILVHVGGKPHFPYTHLQRLEIDGDGFLKDLVLDFSPELNTLVGGRGVGKSAILETIRYVLDLPLYSPTEYRDALVRYALGSGGRARLYVVQYLNARTVRHYRFERGWDESPRVLELEPEREVDLRPLDVLDEREAPLYFGQKEIFDITQSPAQRRQLLDGIIGKQAAAQIAQVRKLETQLKENARQLLDYQRQLLEKDDIEQTLREVRHKINVYQQYGLAKKLSQATALAADEARLQRAINETESSIPQWEAFMQDWDARWKPLLETLREGKSDLKDILQKTAKRVANLHDETQKLLATGKAALEAGKQDLTQLKKQWDEARRPLDEDIRRIKQELGEQSLDPDELMKLTGSETGLNAQLRILQDIQNKVQQAGEERVQLLGKLRDARHKVWELRNAQAEEINTKLGQRVRIQVQYRGDRKTYSEALKTFFRGSGIDKQHTIEKLARDAVDGVELAKKARADTQDLAKAYTISEKRAKQIVTYLQADNGRFYELELLAPPDAVQVFLGNRPIEHLSAGQRATAMLLILLVQDDRVMIVDQPEDDLDNRFIYQDIVRILREQKGKRQFLSATHNPNIPVLAHAEIVIALESEDNQCKVSLQGGMDHRDVQNFVRNVMEGGEEAFRRRAQKYGLD